MAETPYPLKQTIYISPRNKPYFDAAKTAGQTGKLPWESSSSMISDLVKGEILGRGIKTKGVAK